MQTINELLEKAAKYQMSPTEIWDQRVSYAYDNLRLAGSSITRKMVEEQATKMFGKKPEEKKR